MIGLVDPRDPVDNCPDCDRSVNWWVNSRCPSCGRVPDEKELCPQCGSPTDASRTDTCDTCNAVVSE